MINPFSECTDNMSGEELTDWHRRTLLHLVNTAWQEGKILEYRYKLMTIDLMDKVSDEDLEVLQREFDIGFIEKCRSVLLERIFKGYDMIRDEQDEPKKAKYETHLAKLENELKELESRWTHQTKYTNWIETLS